MDLDLQWKEITFEGTQPGITIPINRAGHCTAVLGDRIYLFGGANPCGLHFNDVWYMKLDGSTWHRTQCTGSLPKPRNGHAGCVISAQELMIFGGIMQVPTRQIYDDIWVLRVEVDGAVWHPVQQHGKIPAARSGHSMCLHDEHVYLFGGSNDDAPLDDLHAFALSSRTWRSIVTASPPPSPREMHIGCIVDGHLIVHGGRGVAGPLGDIHLLELNKDVPDWHCIQLVTPEIAIMAHAAVLLRNCELFIVGGVVAAETGESLLLTIDPQKSVASYKVLGNTDTTLGKGRRFAHSLALHGNMLYCIGGAELTTDQPEAPLQEKIRVFTAQLTP